MRKILGSKKLLGVAALTCLLSPHITQAATVYAYYQSTPFPKYKYNGTVMPQDIEKVHIWDGWLDVLHKGAAFQRDTRLIVGYPSSPMQQDWAYLEFDVTGLPQRPTATVLYLWPDAVTPNGDIIWPATINAKWLPDTLATGNSPLATRFSSSVPGPLANQWWGLDITKPYTGWKTGANYGLRLEASNSERLPAIFRSSRDAGVGGRPILAFSYNQPTGMPDFKMPLPGGYSWIVTEEIGGYDCMGTIPWPDTFHQNANYFSVDFAPANKKDGGGAYPGADMPVLAAAAGKILDFGGSPTDTRGYYITIDHGNGYQTRYLHLKQSPARKNGAKFVRNSSVVSRGDQLGVMGKTGTTATHLHVNFWYNGNGSANTPLTYALMEGLLLKSFQTECSVNSKGWASGYSAYYHSSNTPTGL